MVAPTLTPIEVGQTFDTSFRPNPISSRYPWVARHWNGRRAPKVILCDDPRAGTGLSCQVRVRSIRKRHRSDHGCIIVDYLRPVGLHLDGLWVDPVLIKKLVAALETRLNVLLFGPHGCGKTSLARALAGYLAWRFVYFNCSAVVDPTDFLATLQIQASESGHPITGFLKTPMLEALEEASEHPNHRYLILLDELTRCPESARNVLMPALDVSRRIFDPTTNRFLEIPENVQFIAAVNRGAEFTGTYGIDPAQLDRFCPLVMDYPPVEEEVKLLAAKFPALGREIIESVVRVADRIRHTPNLSGGLSVRATEMACVLLAHPIYSENRRQELPEILRSVFCGRIGAGRTEDVTSEAGAAWTIIESELKLPVARAKPTGAETQLTLEDPFA